MKSVLISIQPKWCELIASGKKTVEVRKTKPKIDVPFKCYIYETTGKLKWCNKCKDPCERPYPNCACHEGWGKVIGEFVCENIECLNERDLFEGMDEISNSRIEEYSCLSIDELLQYKGNKDEIYAWHISDLVIYDKPKELGEFKKPCDHKNDCCTCDRYNVFDHLCRDKFTRPPQSWCYVEE
jgi:predicted transcriptional regulator